VSRALRILAKVLYWVAVLVVSLALLVGLILLLESRDDSEIEGGSRPAPPSRAAQIR
jgi:hypothetical protein